LPITAQATNLNDVLLALNEYVPYLLALDSGLAGKPVNGEEVDVILESELEVEWRPSLAATIPGKETPRVKGRGLDYELSFVLTTIAYTYTLLAKVQLRTLYAASTPAPEQRATAINVAIKFLLQAHGIHGYLSSRSHEVQYPPAAVDISGTTQGALASLSMAEATILATLKDDPYPAIVAQSRNKDDYEWMIKAPEIPKVRAHLFGRLALAAATHAGQAYALLQANDTAKGKTVSQSLLKYSEDFQNTSRAKACRFFGVDSELSGNYGVAIAWLIGGMGELRIKYTEENGAAAKGLAKLKKDWTERREDKKIEKGTEWGNDAGRLEEGRIIEMLEVKWNKTNNVVSTAWWPKLTLIVTHPRSVANKYRRQTRWLQRCHQGERSMQHRSTITFRALM
jgi:hypothetical protein